MNYVILAKVIACPLLSSKPFHGPMVISNELYVHGLSLGKNGMDKLHRTSSIIKGNQQRCSRLSNWFSLRRLRPWMNHLPPVWWLTIRFRFLIASWCENLIWWRGSFSLLSRLYWYYTRYPCFAYYFSSQIVLLSNNLFIISTLYWHFP